MLPIADRFRQSAWYYRDLIDSQASGRRAWRLLQRPEDWARGDLAQSKFGDPVELAACPTRICVTGALLRAYNTFDSFADAYTRLGVVVWERFGKSIENWNDDPTLRHGIMLSLLHELDV